MPYYRRWRQEGGKVFLTIVTYGRRKFLTSPDARAILRDAMTDTRQDRPWTTDGIVLLPDHLHVLWTLPPGDDDYSTRVALIKKSFTETWLAGGRAEAASTAAQKRTRRRGLWQVRFWEHLIRDARDYAEHLEYIHRNPVHHGYVKYPREWEWSSFHRYLRAGCYEPDWQGRIDLRENLEYYWHDA